MGWWAGPEGRIPAARALQPLLAGAVLRGVDWLFEWGGGEGARVGVRGRARVCAEACSLLVLASQLMLASRLVAEMG
jgi:hypothetical protein